MSTTPPADPIAPADPMALFRDMVGQWEKFANQYGGQMLQRPEAAQAMHAATNAGLQLQNAVQEGMSKVLTAANMPSKAEVADIGQRLTAIEASLARIEAALLPAAPSDAARPPRTRKPVDQA